jgi:Ca2+-binding RTX toxin-like protein
MATFTGTNSNDTLTGGSGNDIFDGQAGIDTVVINSSSADATFDLNFLGDWQITGPQGVDELKNIEQVQFTNGLVKLQAGGQTLINTTTRYDQNYSAITALADGGYLVTWWGNGAGDSSGIFTQRYNAAGSKVGSETLINTLKSDDQNFPAITALADGGYVVTWTSHDGYDDGIFAQRFDAGGNALIASTHAAGGLDSVYAFFSYTLPDNIEGLWLQGNANLIGKGNSINNMLVGNDGKNRIAGFSGDDTLDGGAGNDILGSGAGNDSIIGGVGNDVLYGYAGNDTLTGGTGKDTLVGGHGSDVYYVEGRDVIVDSLVAGSGIDTVLSASSYKLGNGLENLILQGEAVTATAGKGNALANVLTGDTGANLLAGMQGNDTIKGGDGADKLYGHEGNDLLLGETGNDTLYGNAGNDILTGGLGVDAFCFKSVGHDVVTDFESGIDNILIKQSNLGIGNMDALIEGAIVSAAPGGFSTTNELIIFTNNISGNITTGKAAAAIGNASTALATGSTKLFAVDNGTNTNLYLFTSADGNAAVAASELKLLATLNGVQDTGAGDYLFMA